MNEFNIEPGETDVQWAVNLSGDTVTTGDIWSFTTEMRQ